MNDVSSRPEYAGVIGKTFKTKDRMWAIGVTADRNYEKRVDYVVLVPGAGFGGPEVVMKETFQAGSLIRVIRVLKASSIVSSQVTYVVEDVQRDRFKDVPIRVNPAGKPNDGNFGLDRALYELVTDNRR